MRSSTSTFSFTATGTSIGFGGFGGGGAVQIYAKAPDQRSTIIEFKDAPGRDASIRSYDGKIGWTKTPLTVLGEYQLSGTELDGARLDAQMAFPSQIKRVLTNLRTLQPATINDREVDVVQGNGPGRLFATLYFDKQTGIQGTLYSGVVNGEKLWFLIGDRGGDTRDFVIFRVGGKIADQVRVNYGAY